MINKVLILGRLTHEPDVRLTQEGLHVTNLRVATNSYAGKDEAGNRREHTEFHRLVLFGKPAEAAATILTKGRLVWASGRLQTRSWEDKEGQKHFTTEVVVDEWQAVGPRTGESEAA